jgi:hypothetical protein
MKQCVNQFILTTVRILNHRGFFCSVGILFRFLMHCKDVIFLYYYDDIKLSDTNQYIFYIHLFCSF